MLSRNKKIHPEYSTDAPGAFQIIGKSSLGLKKYTRNTRRVLSEPFRSLEKALSESKKYTWNTRRVLSEPFGSWKKLPRIKTMHPEYSTSALGAFQIIGKSSLGIKNTPGILDKCSRSLSDRLKKLSRIHKKCTRNTRRVLSEHFRCSLGIKKIHPEHSTSALGAFQNIGKSFLGIKKNTPGILDECSRSLSDRWKKLSRNQKYTRNARRVLSEPFRTLEKVSRNKKIHPEY